MAGLEKGADLRWLKCSSHEAIVSTKTTFTHTFVLFESNVHGLPLVTFLALDLL